MRRLHFVMLTCAGLLLSVTFADGRNWSEEKDDVKVQNVSVVVDTGCSVCFSGDVNLSEASNFSNSGTLWFKNASPADVLFPARNLGSGKFIFSGSADCTLFSQNSSVSFLSMETTGSGVFLTGSLSILDRLRLQSGIIHVDGNSLLKVDSDLPNAVVFDNSASNQSYINGGLTRKAMPGGTFWFPVGSSRSFHPFFINEIEKQNQVTVQFDPVFFAGSSFAAAHPQIRSVGAGGWKVESDHPAPAQFHIGASLWDENKVPAGYDRYGIIYASAGDAHLADCKLDLNAYRVNEFLASSVKMTDGFFGFAREATIQLINFILLDGSSNSVFEVPGISEYSRIELKVFNHWGASVYTNNNYQNDLDFRNYSPGTYYYQMILWAGESSTVIRNIIEVKAGS